ncbi:NAD-binding protein [Bacillus solimangrovi]|nr:NAD-binding protein [Bacillus solimangrovi]
MLTFVIGVFGFKVTYGYSIDEAAYNSVRMFFINFDIPVYPAPPLYLIVTKWLAFFIVVSSIVHIILFSMFERINFYFITHHSSFITIIGLNDYSVSLALDLLKQRKKVLLLTENNDDSKIQTLKLNGVKVLCGDITDQALYKKMCVERSRNIIIYTMSDSQNLDALMELDEYLLNKKLDSPIKTIVHFVDKQLEDVIQEIEKEVSKAHFDLKLLNIYENSAKQLFFKKPLYENIDMDKENAHLLIVGFGRIGENILLQAAKIAHFPSERPLRVTVIDSDAETLSSWFYLRYPLINKVCDIQFLSYDIRTKEFKEHIRQIKTSENQYSYIAICLNDDELSLKAALNFMTELKTVPTGIKMIRDSTFARWIDNHNKKFHNLFRFGNTDDISNVGTIINEKQDRLAKAIHDLYLKKNENGQPWNNLTAFIKSSNRAQADHIDAKLSYLGLRQVSTGEVSEKMYTTINLQEFNSMLVNKLERLAITEHNRWNAFHHINGYTQIPPHEEIDHENKKHYCLTTWNDLDEVSQVRSEIKGNQVNYKELDRHSVQRIFKIVEAAGDKIVKPMNAKEGKFDDI